MAPYAQDHFAAPLALATRVPANPENPEVVEDAAGVVVAAAVVVAVAEPELPLEDVDAVEEEAVLRKSNDPAAVVAEAEEVFALAAANAPKLAKTLGAAPPS